MGVFARRLEVSMHILQARAQFCQDWEKIMRRCHFSRTERVLTAWSVARAVTAGQESSGKKLIVDLGADYTNVFIYGRESILDYKVVLTAQKSDIRGDKRVLSAKELLGKHSDVQEILVTGDLAEEENEKQAWVEMAEGIPVRPAAPQGLTKLAQPRYASAVGLLWAADELMKKSPALNKEKTFMGGIKQKARTFIQEYF
jgi:cell division ATPase FtsA